MREIKFKIWLPYSKVMIQPKDITTIWESILNGVTIGQMKQWVHLQYTGLKNKNGKEIYEGDMIKHNDNLFIVWHFENYGLCLVDSKRFDLNRSKLLIKDNWRDLNWLYNTQKRVEVIGNIYENPELLKPQP